jgi:uncharacterized protein (DUF1778 family)
MLMQKTANPITATSADVTALKALTKRCVFYLNDAQWRAFTAALESPSKPKPRLRRLIKSRSVLER